MRKLRSEKLNDELEVFNEGGMDTRRSGVTTLMLSL